MSRSCPVSRFLALVIAAAAFLVVPVSADAAVQPCTVTYAKTGGAIRVGPDPGKNHSLNAFSLTVPDVRTVIDLDVSYSIDFPAAQSLAIHLLGPRTGPTLVPTVQTLNPGMASGTMRGLYTFDDEAATAKVAGATPLPGTYLPATPAKALEDHPAAGTWSLWILNYSTAASGTLGSFTVTLTYATCDSDGDGVEEKVDNCTVVANPDQADIDADAFGDSCDLDVDGDDRPDASDGCPRSAAATASGCPTVGRTAALRPTKAARSLRLVVRSDADGCRSGATVTLFRVKRGKDAKVVGATTDANGRHKFKAPRRAGRYYVRVPASYAAGEAECSAARSGRQRVTRRGPIPVRVAAVDTDGDGLDDLVDGCPTVASGNPTGCPSAWRKVSLTWLASASRLQARVTSPVSACAARARIKLFLDRAGRADKLLSSDASSRGRRRFTVPGGKRYYVLVSPSYSSGVAECGKAVSRTVRVPRT
jgi:hypothetical protein